MTAQVLIATKECIVTSSDKAATMSDGKTYDGLRKIFKLTDEFPAEVMFNGNADFENLSIETLISKFKNTVDFKKLKTIEKIKNEFIKFLSHNTESTDVNEYLKTLISSFKDELIIQIDYDGFDEVINNSKGKEAPAFVKEYTNFDNEFYDIIPDDKDKSQLNQVIWEIFSYELSFEGTGVIFAGFDVEHDYPSFFEIRIYCNNQGEIIYEDVDSKVNSKDPFIKVFAINEEAYTFITGVNLEFEDDLNYYINETNEIIIRNIKNLLENENIENIDMIVDICKTAIKDEYLDLKEYFNDYRLDTIEYTSSQIEYLPRWLLCDLADYLIQLTGLKQKISSEIESVSMDADVSLITKYDGFKWIKYDYKRV